MDNTTYYDQFNWQSANLSDRLKVKIQLLLNIIPDDVHSILDIGCGDGVISEALSSKYKVFATDRSYKSLELVRTTKFQSSADELPVASQNVDMVFSSEMLEHLPEKIFNGAIGEIKRATKKYVLLTFPNDENTDKNLVQCPNCQFIFNKSYHLRNLNLSKITSLFSEYTLQKHFVLGAKIRNCTFIYKA